VANKKEVVAGQLWAKPQVRAKVLQAAMEVIAEVGPDRVTVKDIADRAGMSTGHVLYYFGKRERILIDTLLLTENDFALRRDRRVARASDEWVATHELTKLYLPVGPRDVRWKLWVQLFANPPRDPETLRQFATVTDSWAHSLESVIDSGISRGLFHSENPAEAAHDYCRMMDGLSLEILLATPGHTRTWAVGKANNFLRRELTIP
jgi:AcrR family transcriptional regulator